MVSWKSPSNNQISTHHILKNNSMEFSKSTLLPILGLLVFSFFIGLSYFNNHIFLDKILLCSVIVGMIFFAKMRGETANNDSDSDQRKYTDPS